MENITSSVTNNLGGQFIGKVPGFLSGYILGVISGVTANWFWDKWKKRKPHLNLELCESGTYFSGMMPREEQEDYLKILKAISTRSSKPASRGTDYQPPDKGSNTKQ